MQCKFFNVQNINELSFLFFFIVVPGYCFIYLNLFEVTPKLATPGIYFKNPTEEILVFSLFSVIDFSRLLKIFPKVVICGKHALTLIQSYNFCFFIISLFFISNRFHFHHCLKICICQQSQQKYMSHSNDQQQFHEHTERTKSKITFDELLTAFLAKLPGLQLDCKLELCQWQK